MPDVTVTLPRLVCEATGAPHHVEVTGEDTYAVLDALFAAHPGVRTHLLDETGALRPNVLCALDGDRTRLEQPEAVRSGSSLTFVPSVAGG
jgi:molybdopterin converting factor small subunit